MNRQSQFFKSQSHFKFWLCIIAACTIPWLTGCSAADKNLVPESFSDSPVIRGQSPSDGLLERANPARLVDSVKRASGYGPDQSIAKTAFEEAEKVFTEASKLEGKERIKRFQAAGKKYAKAAGRWPESALEEDAMFMLAESHFFADEYPEASKAYGKLVKKYQNTRHMDTVNKRRFSLARYWVQHHESNPDWPITPNVTAKERPLFDKFGHGVRVLDNIRFDDPTGKLADDATMAAAVAFFKQGKYLRADDMFNDLRRAFPNSEHQFQAHLLSLKCKLELYQGPQYSSTPMDEAEEIIKQIHRQFPEESRQNREFLTEAWKKTRMNKAMHDWEMAKYYDNRREYAAARQYYERVRKDYSDTSLAGDAAKRIEKIADKAPKPDQPLPWLSKMFPTPEREKPLVARNPLDSLRR